MPAPNPAFGAHLQPFAGITSFMRCPATRDLLGADVAIVGAPYDSATSYRSGARFGPRKIREASAMLWGHHNPFDLKPLAALNVVDYGDVDVIPTAILETYRHIEAEVGAILSAGLTVITLGGDHSISLPLLRAHAQKYGPLSVIHFDAHPDTWEREFGNQPYSHGTGFMRALEEKLIAPERYIQVGLRGPTETGRDWQKTRDLGGHVITADEAWHLGLPTVIETIRAVAQGPVYVTFDIDVADPAFAPGTGTPEVGGFASRELLQILRGLRGLNFVGFDLVEVSPPYDHSDLTALLAANVVFEFLALLADCKKQ
jgi:agmatinase/guanidinopropionase